MKCVVSETGRGGGWGVSRDIERGDGGRRDGLTPRHVEEYTREHFAQQVTTSSEMMLWITTSCNGRRENYWGKYYDTERSSGSKDMNTQPQPDRNGSTGSQQRSRLSA